MKNIFLFLCLSVILAGCATVKKQPPRVTAPSDWWTGSIELPRAFTVCESSESIRVTKYLEYDLFVASCAVLSREIQKLKKQIAAIEIRWDDPKLSSCAFQSAVFKIGSGHAGIFLSFPLGRDFSQEERDQARLNPRLIIQSDDSFNRSLAIIGACGITALILLGFFAEREAKRRRRKGKPDAGKYETMKVCNCDGTPRLRGFVYVCGKCGGVKGL